MKKISKGCCIIKAELLDITVTSFFTVHIIFPNIPKRISLLFHYTIKRAASFSKHFVWVASQGEAQPRQTEAPRKERSDQMLGGMGTNDVPLYKPSRIEKDC